MHSGRGSFSKKLLRDTERPDGNSLESLLGEPAARLQLRVLAWFRCMSARIAPSEAPYNDGWWRIRWIPMEDRSANCCARAAGSVPGTAARWRPYVKKSISPPDDTSQ